MTLDITAVYLVLIFAAVFLVSQSLFGLLRTAKVKRMVNQRLRVAERVGGIQELVIELRKQRGLTAGGDLKSGMQWLAKLIVASGVPYDARRWLTFIGLSALAGAAGVLFLTKSLVIAPLGALVGGLIAPYAFLKFKAGQRSTALSEQLPQALDIVVRSLEAGHPVPTAVSLVGREMPDPIGSEFGMAADEISYGATLEQAVERMANRCQHLDVDLFAATIRLQERAGGNLTGLLKLNAHTVRERQKMRLKIQAASAEGRVSALILSSSPFVAVGAILVMAPDFYGEVIHVPFVQFGLAGLGVWMLIGNIVMRRMIAMKI